MGRDKNVGLPLEKRGVTLLKTRGNPMGPMGSMGPVGPMGPMGPMGSMGPMMRGTSSWIRGT